jgi:hypothetical protein
MPDHPVLVGHFFSIRRWLGSRPLGNGNINDTWQVDFESDAGPLSYVLQRLNHHVFREPIALMANIERINAHLIADPTYSYAVSSVMLTQRGATLHLDEQGNYWRMMELIPHSYSPETLLNASVAFEAAKAYGAFSRSLRHFPPEALHETILGFHDTDRRWAYFLEILEKAPETRLLAAENEIKAVFGFKNTFDTISGLKKSGQLPLRVTHNDTKAGNVLLDQTSHAALAVIDLDTVMGGTILSDFGDMVRTFCPLGYEDAATEVMFRHDVLDALTAGFLSEMADFLSPSERVHLLLGAKWIIGEQALRFLTDYLEGDVYFKIHYPTHNLVRTRNQINLYHAVP